jgi:nucleoside-diphosphate-sugar epimerase
MVGEAVLPSLRKLGNVLLIGRHAESDMYFDFTDRPVQKKRASCDVLLNCAAAFGGDVLEEAKLNYEVNAIGCLHILELAKMLNAKQILHLSSLSADLESTPQLFNSYALSKRQGEEILALHGQQYGITVSSLRPTQIIDTKGKSERHQKLFFYLVRRAAEGADFVLSGTDPASRNYIHLEDVCRAIMNMITRPHAGVFTLGSPSNVCAEEVYNLAKDLCGANGKFIQKLEGAQVPSYPVPDSSKTYEQFDCLPQRSLEEMIRSVLQLSGAV